MQPTRHLLSSISWSQRVCFSTHSAKRCYSQKSSKPLRILFCGSDYFSSSALRALHNEQKKDPEGIQSIDVLCRPGKRTGRSLKVIKEVPIKGVAVELGLTVHERDTFTGWDLPKPNGESINLIVAVSFGLFVPSRILKSAEYGGLNVHPSLLPNFRGAAPLQYTIMHGEEYTGVTLQTLDHKSFDHGTILAQTLSPGLKLDLSKKPTFADLLNLITPVGANMLVTGIRDRIFVPPLPELTLPRPSQHLIHAQKISSQDKEIDWLNWDAATIARRYRALGPLWSTVCPDGKRKLRIKFEGIEEVDIPKTGEQLGAESQPKLSESGKEPVLSQVNYILHGAHNGMELALSFVTDCDGIVIPVNGMAVRISHITIEGMGRKSARLAMLALQGGNSSGAQGQDRHESNVASRGLQKNV